MKINLRPGFMRKLATACLLFLIGSIVLDIAIVQGVLVGGFEWIVWGVFDTVDTDVPLPASDGG